MTSDSLLLTLLISGTSLLSMAIGGWIAHGQHKRQHNRMVARLVDAADGNGHVSPAQFVVAFGACYGLACGVISLFLR